MKKVLVLDGGGSRGVITLQWLLEIEKATNKNIGDIFDLIIGTSVGSIIAVTLNYYDNSGKPVYRSVSDIIDLFFDILPDIFSRSLWHRITTFNGIIGPKYDVQYVDTILDNILNNTKMNELHNDTLITTAMIEPSIKYYEFTSKDNIKASSAIKCSISAPTYFEAEICTYDGVLYEFIDGGVGANNPSLAGYFEAKKIYGNDSDILIVSIGTGYIPSSGIDEKYSGALQWCIPISDVMIDDSMSFADYQIKKILEQGKRYFRLNVPISNDENIIDQTDKDILNNMMERVQIALEDDDRMAKFMNMCDILIS